MRPAADSARGVASPDEARRLIEGVLAVMRDLQALMARESAHVRVGRVRQGLSEEARKTELASAYLQGLEGVKANAIALARLAPEALERLKAEHRRFNEAASENQIVLATARAVSETLVKSLAEELQRGARPQVYAPPSRSAPGRAGPGEALVLSKVL